MSDPSIVVIRPFRPQDDAEVHSLIYESTLAPVNEFFVQSLMREIFFQTVVVTAAIMFIFLGVPFYWTLSAIPLVTLAFYIVILSSHYYKARYLHPDLKDILETYLASNKTCFFVAEAFGSPPSSKPSRLSRNSFASPIAFISFAEFEHLDRNGAISGVGRRREIIGTVGITRDHNSAVVAWLKRMSVTKAWRGLGVGSELVDTAIKFCNSRSFVSIELVTTECHTSAYKLYEKKGFETKTMFHKKFFFLSSSAITMHFMSYKTRPTYRASGVDL